MDHGGHLALGIPDHGQLGVGPPDEELRIASRAQPKSGLARQLELKPPVFATYGGSHPAGAVNHADLTGCYASTNPSDVSLGGL
jgi:hypothetical protein